MQVESIKIDEKLLNSYQSCPENTQNLHNQA